MLAVAGAVAGAVVVGASVVEGASVVPAYKRLLIGCAKPSVLPGPIPSTEP